MSYTPEINCDELSNKMLECLNNTDHEQCKELVEEFKNCCQKEETDEQNE